MKFSPYPENELGGVIHAAKCWGRTKVWILTNLDRYGNEDGWPASIAGRAYVPIGGFYSGKAIEVMREDALWVSVASKGMPELPYCTLFLQYVCIKGKRKDGLLYKIPVKRKAAELGMGTNDYYKHLNGAHMWLAAREPESVRTESPVTVRNEVPIFRGQLCSV